MTSKIENEIEKMLFEVIGHIFVGFSILYYAKVVWEDRVDGGESALMARAHSRITETNKCGLGSGHFRFTI